jgi:serine/threonine protein kinase
MQQEVHPFK